MAVPSITLRAVASNENEWRDVVRGHEPERPEYTRQLDEFLLSVRTGRSEPPGLRVAALGVDILAAAETAATQ